MFFSNTSKVLPKDSISYLTSAIEEDFSTISILANTAFIFLVRTLYCFVKILQRRQALFHLFLKCRKLVFMESKPFIQFKGAFLKIS